MTPHKDYFLAPPPAPTATLPPSPVLSEALQICHPHAAGVDLGEAEHWGAVSPGCDPQPGRLLAPAPPTSMPSPTGFLTVA